MSTAPGATFFGGLQKGLTTPFTAASNLFSSGPANPLSQGIFGSSRSLAGAGLFGKTLTPRYNPNATAIVDPSGFGAAATPSSDFSMDTFSEGAASQAQVPTGGSVAPVPAGVSAGVTGGISTDPSSLIQTNFADPAFAGNPVLGQNINAGAFPSPEDLRLAEADAAAREFLTSPLVAKEFPGAPVDVVTANQPSIVGPVTANKPIVGPGEYSGVSDSMAELGRAPTTGPYTPEAVANASANASANAPKVVSGADSPDRSFYQKAIDYFNPSEEAAKAARLRDLATYQEGLKADYLQASGGEVIPKAQLQAKSLKWLQDNPEAGFLRRIAPLGVAGLTGVGFLTGAFDFGEDEEELRNKNLDAASEEMRAYDEWKKIGDKNSPRAQALYFKWHGQPNRTRSQFEYLTGGKSSRPDWMFLPEDFQEYRAMGGEVIGPGTGTSDSIPARLSDGEFVMTADAVRNAGGGDRNLGAARMYDMMRRFEGGTA